MAEMAGRRSHHRPAGSGRRPWSPVDAEGAAGAAFVRPDDDRVVADLDARRPTARGPGIAVADEVDVDLEGVGTDLTHGVGAERVAVLDGKLAPRGVPVVDVGEMGEPEPRKGSTTLTRWSRPAVPKSTSSAR
nr:hypothetical protein [Tessaracoccus coleopterorum]